MFYIGDREGGGWCVSSTLCRYDIRMGLIGSELGEGCKCWCIGSTLVSSCRCCVLVSCVHPVAILRAVFCTICSLSMFVSDALGDHMVEAYSSTGLVMALYVASMVSLCLPHLVEVRTLSMLMVLRALVAARSMCLL